MTGMANGATRDALRRGNLGACLRHVHLAGPVTRSELGELTGLNRSTIGDLVGDLAERGLVHERPGTPERLTGLTVASRRGRR